MHNVGKIDRIIRLIVGLVFVILYFLKIADGAWDSYFVFGAAILLMTSMRRCCPIYTMLGFGTCGIPSSDNEAKIQTKKVKLK